MKEIDLIKYAKKAARPLVFGGLLITAGCGAAPTASPSGSAEASHSPVAAASVGPEPAPSQKPLTADQIQSAVAQGVKEGVQAAMQAGNKGAKYSDQTGGTINGGSESASPVPSGLGSTGSVPKGSESPSPAPAATSADCQFPVPDSFQPESNSPNKVDNFFLEQAPQGRWFHPMTHLRFQSNAQDIWSYQYYFGFKVSASSPSDKVELTQHGGEEGLMVVRQESGPIHLDAAVGILDSFTDSKGNTKDLRGDIRTGFDPSVVPSIWFRTHPNVVVKVFNPDTGQQLTKDGKPVQGTTSESGDIGFGMGDQPVRACFDMQIPQDAKLETLEWKGPHDRVQADVNWIDLRGIIKPASVTGK